MIIAAIDPGPTHSALLVLEGTRVHLAAPAFENAAVLEWIRNGDDELEIVADVLLIEKIEAQGMAVGAEVFETVFWSGRFAQAWEAGVGDVAVRIGRRAIKLALCGTSRANDGNIRAALLDRFGGLTAAVGKKRTPGPLYGVKSHAWAALALAVTYQQQDGMPPV